MSGIVGPSAVKPLDGFQPATKLLRILIETKFLKYEGQRTGRIAIAGELVMVIIIKFGIVLMPNIHHRNLGISQFFLGWIPPKNGNGKF